MIAYFVYNLNGYSGAAQQAWLLAKSLGEPVIFFNHEKGRYKKEKRDGFEIINLPENKIIKGLVIFYFLIKKRIKIIHLHGFFKHGIVLGSILRRKVILKTTLMGSDDFESLYKNVRRKRNIKKLMNSIDINVCLTNQIYTTNEKYIDKSKLRVIPNGVELPEHVLTQKENIFCFVGLICERKGTFESIEYYLKNYIDLPNSKMYVVGPLDGLNESDKTYVKKCFSLVERYNASESIIFTDNIPKSEVQEIFRVSKALIFFSKNEGMPNVVLEAINNNCLPITLGLDGVVNEILGEDIGAQLVLESPSDVIDVSVMNELIKRSNVSDIARKNFSIYSISQKYKKLYEVLALECK